VQPSEVNPLSATAATPSVDPERTAAEREAELVLGLLTQSPLATGPVTPPPPAPPKPEDEFPPSMTVLTSLADMQAAVNRLAASAQRLISLYSPELEAELYEQTEFLDIIKRFVLGRNFAKVRVVLGHSEPLLRANNRFVAMARRLTSYIDIRLENNRVPQRAASYIIADDRAIMLRTDLETEEGIADFGNPAIARLHLAEFDAVWIANDPAPMFMPRPRRKA
jgi:hypothetical protein